MTTLDNADYGKLGQASTCTPYHPPREDGEPTSYRIWLSWVEAHSQTHRQARCPACGKLKVWVLR